MKAKDKLVDLVAQSKTKDLSSIKLVGTTLSSLSEFQDEVSVQCAVRFLFYLKKVDQIMVLV